MPEKQQGKCHTQKTTALNHGDGRKHIRGDGERQKSPVASVTGVTKLRCSHQAGLTAAVLLFLAQ